jgi:hypothetical protein
MLDTYDEHNPNNPINQEEEAKEIMPTPSNLLEAIDLCNDVFIDSYISEINYNLVDLIDYAESSQNRWLANQLNSIKNLLK